MRKSHHFALKVPSMLIFLAFIALRQYLHLTFIRLPSHAFLNILRLFFLFLSYVPQHDFFVSFGQIGKISLSSILIESLIFSVVSLLILFHLFELLLMLFIILFQFSRFLLTKPLVLLFYLHAMILKLSLLFCQGNCIVPLLIG